MHKNIFEKITHAQKDIGSEGFDGWLLYDFRRSNSLACKFLELPPDRMLTRRFFYFIPASGEPIKLLHKIESHILDHLPGKIVTFTTWQELEKRLKEILKDSSTVAMEYSPGNAMPYVSKVDAGTVELIRGFGITVASSADILQQYSGVWTEKQLESHLKAAEALDQIALKTWHFISDALRFEKQISEYEVQQFILDEMQFRNCHTDAPPICAVNQHSANPHFEPKKENREPIKKGDFILIDLWCKQKADHAVYADITRVAVAAQQPTRKQQEVFDIVRKAQETATELVRERVGQNKPVRGWEVDEAARDVIGGAGYGDFFTHRTGHNIDTNDHGDGANIDNFETHDTRKLLPGTCFSIEPGIYLPGEFGIRLEYDVYIDPRGEIMVTGGKQDQIVCLL